MNNSIDLQPFVQIDNSFTLLIAPPAWGKTMLLIELFKRSDKHWVFLSPLRALANEFYVKVCDVLPTVLVSNIKESNELIRGFFSHEKSLLIITPELCHDRFFQMVEDLSDGDLIFILDEFHLFYYWGESFRPRMWEVFMRVANCGSSVLGLSATISKDKLDLMKNDILVGFSQHYILDLGNHTFRNHPTKIHFYLKFFRNFFDKKFEYDLVTASSKTILYFCKYRSEVDQMVQKYTRLGYSVLGCKGGEAAAFTNALALNAHPDCIFATTALSHGVNLPVIDKIYLGYPIDNLDFWIQMVGRGGRDGSNYIIHTFDSFFQTINHRIFSTIQVLSIQLYLKAFFFFYGTTKEY